MQLARFSLLLPLLLSCVNAALWDWPNVLNVRNQPSSQGDLSVNAHTDLGAWHGFALPTNPSSFGFVGPFVHGAGNVS